MTLMTSERIRAITHLYGLEYLSMNGRYEFGTGGTVPNVHGPVPSALCHHAVSISRSIGVTALLH